MTERCDLTRKPIVSGIESESFEKYHGEGHPNPRLIFGLIAYPNEMELILSKEYNKLVSPTISHLEGCGHCIGIMRKLVKFY